MPCAIMAIMYYFFLHVLRCHIRFSVLALCPSILVLPVIPLTTMAQNTFRTRLLRIPLVRSLVMRGG